MNPLGNGNLGGLSPQVRQMISQIKPMMKMFNGDLSQLAQQNPMVNQAMQMCNGKDPKEVFYQMARNNGIDPDAFIRELRG